MESEKRINWLSLFIKVVIIFIFVLIIIWLVSKIIVRTKLSETFTNNIKNMEKVSLEYFKTVDLPLEKGDNLKITLEEMIDKNLIVSVGSDSGNNCNTEKSYSKITREKNKYIVETTLKCGEEKDTIKTNFSLKDCKNCNQGANNNSDKNDTTSEKDNTTTNSGNTNTNGITYYEHIKETTTYTKWVRGSLTGDNIENKAEYYGVDYKTYYTLGVISSDKKSITYTLKLKNVPNDKYLFTTIDEVTHYTSSDENNYLNEKDILLYKGNKANTPSENISNYSLGESNFTYKISPYYREGSFYIRITIKLNNTDGASTYYDTKIQKNAYLIPLKIKVKFASNVISETKPDGEYETLSYYRYVTKNRETIWSTKDYVEGYNKTGNTKVK